MSPRKPAVLRESDGPGLREYLIATAARMIGQRGSAGLTVRDIASEAHVSDGVLYNYFEDKEDLLASALLAHIGAVMSVAPPMPEPGTGTVAGNLALFIEGGLATLARVAPAFAGLVSQPGVLTRFHAMAGGDAAFGVADTGRRPGGGSDHRGEGLPAILATYLHAEQRLGRIGPAVDINAATALIIGAIHGQVLPRMLFSPQAGQAAAPPGLAGRLAETVTFGLGPPPARAQSGRASDPGPAGRGQNQPGLQGDTS
jgi:AcrR family transcriptional regulator